MNVVIESSSNTTFGIKAASSSRGWIAGGFLTWEHAERWATRNGLRVVNSNPHTAPCAVLRPGRTVGTRGARLSPVRPNPGQAGVM